MLRRLSFIVTILLSGACATQRTASSIENKPKRETASRELRDVLLVGNTVSGTISIIDEKTLENIGSINVIPDFPDRIGEITDDIRRLVVYGTLRSNSVLAKFEPDGGKRFVDDVFLSPDGETIYVSRGNLGDMIAIDLMTPGFPIIWRTVIANYKADHASLSPDGKRIVVSASLAQIAQVLDTSDGHVIGSFPTGTLPHQNDFSADGKRIYNGSLGRLEIPYLPDAVKGKRQITVVDADTFKELHVYKFPAGVRPTIIQEEQGLIYLQLSHHNGVVKYDMKTEKIIAKNEQPFSEFAKANYKKKTDYPHDSAHHGLALSGDGKKLCDAGTIDNTASIVSTEKMETLSIVNTGMIPYWATTSGDGKKCFVTLSGDNAVAVIDYDSGKELKRVQVGRMPQRSRLGRIAENVIARLNK